MTTSLPTPIRVPPRAGKPLALLIPGLDGTGRFFDGHLDALSSRYRTVSWEFRRRAPFDFPDLVQELGDATAGEPRGSITVVGESFGGTVALHYVLAYPERVCMLGLINTFSFYTRRRRIKLGCRLAPLLSWRGIRVLKNLIAERILAVEGIPPGGRNHYHAIVAQIDQKAYRRRLELVRDVDLRRRLPEISVPTLIFASRRDKIVPSVPAGRFLAARILNSRFYEFPEAGHALLLTPGFSLADYV
jgi:pimeloyl-ACP methyl ester carboxylesterase